MFWVGDVRKEWRFYQEHKEDSGPAITGSVKVRDILLGAFACVLPDSYEVLILRVYIWLKIGIHFSKFLSQKVYIKSVTWIYFLNIFPIFTSVWMEPWSKISVVLIPELD